MDTTDSPQRTGETVTATRWLAVGSLLGLIILGVAWELWLAPLRPGGTLLALKVLPLCIPIAGLLRNRMYTYRWVSLLIWPYFTEGVVRAYRADTVTTILALIEILLCLSLFAACVLHIRTRLSKARIEPAASSTH